MAASPVGLAAEFGPGRGSSWVRAAAEVPEVATACGASADGPAVAHGSGGGAAAVGATAGVSGAAAGSRQQAARSILGPPTPAVPVGYAPGEHELNKHMPPVQFVPETAPEDLPISETDNDSLGSDIGSDYGNQAGASAMDTSHSGDGGGSEQVRQGGGNLNNKRNGLGWDGQAGLMAGTGGGPINSTCQ
jgi:hypothetical protein